MTRIMRMVGLMTAFLAASFSFAQEGISQQQVAPANLSKNPALASVKIEEHPGVKPPSEAVFRDENGKTVTFGSLFKGHPIVLLPIFYRCTGVCNLELQGVLNALQHSPQLVPGKNIDIVALGINPKEGPDLALGKKQSTMEEYGKPKTASGWHFLTGNMDNIRSVTDPIGFRFTYDATKDVVNHPSGVMVLTPTGQVSSYMLAGTYDVSKFQKDVALASKEQIAPKSEEEWLGCVCVDPVTGKRSLVIQGILRVFGVVTVSVLMLGIFFLSRKPRTKIS